QPIELLHRDGAPPADRLALGRTACARVVAVHATVLGSTGPEHHSAATGGAYREPGQKRRTGRYSRRHDSRAAGVQLPLDACEDVLPNDRGHGNFDDLFVGLPPVRLRRGPIVSPAADVDGVGEQLVDASDAERFSSARTISPGIQPLDDLFDAERA